MKVHHVSSPTQLWVSVEEHIPLRRGDLPRACHAGYCGAASQLAMDLALHYHKQEHRCLHVKPEEGDHCAVMDGSGCYHRVTVLEFSQPLGLYFHSREKARVRILGVGRLTPSCPLTTTDQVRLIDTGEVEVVDVSQLLTLPDQFLSHPPLVVEAVVCGVVPCDEDTDWPPPVSIVVSCISRQQPCLHPYRPFS